MPVNAFPEFFSRPHPVKKKNRFTNPKPLALRREVAVFFSLESEKFCTSHSEIFVLWIIPCYDMQIKLGDMIYFQN